MILTGIAVVLTDDYLKCRQKMKLAIENDMSNVESEMEFMPGDRPRRKRLAINYYWRLESLLAITSVDLFVGSV